jgi:MFS family permease
MALWIWGPLVWPFLAVIGVFVPGYDDWRFNLVLLALYAVYFAVFCLPRLKAVRRRTKELLCETEWARSQGYTPERLRLLKFPWQK